MRVVVLLLLILSSTLSRANENAEQIFADMAPALYQIRIIDKATGEKSGIGSGFQIGENGYIATNYHVISGYAQHPEKYIIEFEDHEGKTGQLNLQTVDVINDLAIVLHEDNPQPLHFIVSEQTPQKGEQLYSLGNPHDLGMIVVPGTYNGLKKEAFNDRIHFTGSVNPGMSGGPVVNAAGDVVGVNVATSGNQIGFLIPHGKLAQLINQFDVQVEKTISEQITEQLEANQSKLITSILATPWESKSFAKASIPQTGVDFIRCWGNSNADRPDDLLFQAITQCQMEESVYISDSFSTGKVSMEFHYFEGDDISTWRFYQNYKASITQAAADNQAGKEDVTEFECQHDITSNSNNKLTNKSIMCVRAYKKYKGLYDIMFLAASVDQTNQALVSHFTLAGVNQTLAQSFTKRFMEASQWN
ncbi:trypsin-like peptidase domain-containing protein [Thalassotalea litorea]|uniref:Trypsin-like peptidase domain-containing protein n=1 Tax=Thalassotalea litorea TaxID=2020715 RepID=A0A5R9IC21_9GAMM|nr:serine protease [Thalassotalea litorea]TLU59933.1 trypsin-like peptidase domain-containing protein [Thalassotalea litorea]